MVGMIATHPLFGRICLPLGWKFYVNENKLETIDEKSRPQLKTKPEIAAELLKRIVPKIQKTGWKVEILFDRGYLAADLFQTIHELDAVAVTRFKKNYEELENLPFRVAVVLENTVAPSSMRTWSPAMKVECNEPWSNATVEKIG